MIADKQSWSNLMAVQTAEFYRGAVPQPKFLHLLQQNTFTIRLEASLIPAFLVLLGK